MLVVKKLDATLEAQRGALYAPPAPNFATATFRQWNRAKPPGTRVLGLKEWIRQVRSEKQHATLEAQSGTLYAPPAPDFATGTFRQWNHVKPPGT